MAKAAKVAIALVILAIIMAILYLTGAVVSREPYWIYWILLTAGIAAGIWLIVKLRK